MGMAASQARLLTITARMHDVEYQAQSIQNAKIALATQSDAVYQKYLEALDATTLTIKNSSGDLIPANFNNLAGRFAVESATNKHYMFRASDNSIIVPDDIAASYEDYSGKGLPDDPYMFALYMCGGNVSIGLYNDDKKENSEDYKKTIEAAENFVTKYAKNSKRLSELKEKRDNLLDPTTNDDLNKVGVLEKTTIEELRNKARTEQDKTTRETYERIVEAYEIADSQYKTELYAGDNAQYIMELCQQVGGGYEIVNGYGESYPEDFELESLTIESTNKIDQGDFDYYVKMYKAIQANFGHISSISDYNGIEGIGDAANNGEWLQNMIKSGKITVDELNIDPKTGLASYASTSVSSNSELAYTTTSTIDKKALAKAEAEYEHETKLIDQKDKKFDMDLNKLETEREALKTEYESVKKVISDNIERTFGIFS